MLSRWTKRVVLLVAVAAAGTAWAQGNDSEELDRLKNQLEQATKELDQSQKELDQLQSELDQASKDVADEYLDILQNLRDVLNDYAGYMKEEPSEAEIHQVKAVDLLRQNLAGGSYADNPEKLLDDIYGAIDGIKAVENEHRVKFNTNSPNCCRLGRSLRKELVIIAELVEDYDDKQTTTILQKDDIKKYLRAALAALAQAESATAEHGRNADAVRKFIEAMVLDGRVVVIPDEFPDTRIAEPRLPDVAEPPEPPEPLEPPVVIYSPRTDRFQGERGAQHTINAQVTVSNLSWPIIVDNPSGDVIITGTNDKVISAKLNLEVSSTSHAKEKEFLDQSILAVGQTTGEYTVTVDLPRLTDHRTQLLNSTLEVAVPRACKVDCSDAFGQVRITDINARVTVDGDKSNVEIERVSGGTMVRNSMGPVTLIEVTGGVDLETSYAPVTMTRCGGEIRIENQYGPIALDGCKGETDINNTGQIDVSGHDGNVTIENAYGRVEIDQVQGNVFVKNGYQAILITNITGSAELENSYAEISVESVGGNLAATNNNGPIFVEALAGPVELSNYYGNTSISLTRAFKGGSTITSTGGTIKVSYVQQPDLVLSLHTTGGSISSSLPLSVKSRGDLKSAELVLGDGGETLDISGTESAIIVQGK